MPATARRLRRRWAAGRGPDPDEGVDLTSIDDPSRFEGSTLVAITLILARLEAALIDSVPDSVVPFGPLNLGGPMDERAAQEGSGEMIHALKSDAAEPLEAWAEVEAHQADEARLTAIADHLREKALGGRTSQQTALDAWQQICERHHATVGRLLYRLVGPADKAATADLLAETFDKIWYGARKWRPGRGTVAGWIYSIAQRSALDLLRAQAARRRNEDAYADDPSLRARGLDPEEEMARKQDHQLIRRAVAWLPRDQQVVVLLRADGLPSPEIAARLGLKLGTVASRLRLGRQRAAELFTRWAESPAEAREAPLLPLVSLEDDELAEVGDE